MDQSAGPQASTKACLGKAARVVNREGATGPILDCAGKPLDLSRARVMGVLNITPDSFSDGGHFLSAGQALRRAAEMVEEGAAIIDVGGESTRPGASPVPLEEELGRVLPVIQALEREIPVPISVDTSKPEVMARAVAAGAGMINDVRALRAPGALAEASRSKVPVCLMHMRGSPRSMQRAPQYTHVLREVCAFLRERRDACEQAGIPRERLLVDPGFGFGKTTEHNLALLAGLDRLVNSGLPVVVGLSRKSMVGRLLNNAPVDRRLYGSLALAVVAASKGARLVRAHDVGATAEALTVAQAVLDANRSEDPIGASWDGN